jgi:hypothetical protein
MCHNYWIIESALNFIGSTNYTVFFLEHTHECYSVNFFEYAEGVHAGFEGSGIGCVASTIFKVLNFLELTSLGIYVLFLYLTTTYEPYV